MLPIKISRVVVVTSVLLGALNEAYAIDAASLELANGNKTQVIRIGVQRDWSASWWRSGGTHVRGYWDASLAHWQGNRFEGVANNKQHITDVSVTAMCRLEADSARGFYAEGGIGPHFLSAHYDNNDRQLSTNFQFGSHLGVGYVFNPSADLGVRITHVSNGGVREPNDGVNLFGLVFRTRF